MQGKNLCNEVALWISEPSAGDVCRLMLNKQQTAVFSAFSTCRNCAACGQGRWLPCSILADIWWSVPPGSYKLFTTAFMFRCYRLRQPVSAVHLPHEVCCAWSRHRLLHSRASVMSSAYSVEAAETLVQLCSIDEWPGSKKLPSCAAAACSVVLSGRSLSRQSNSSQLGYHSEVHGALYTAEDDRVLQQLLVSLLGRLWQ